MTVAAIIRGAGGLALLLLVGCTTLTPAQEESASEVRALANRTALIYGLPPIPLQVSVDPDGPLGSYRREFFS
ncbi:MAG TPA: hypothetical protein VEL75_14670, partial [Candidatus Methylomirabilis sp.]|nr:hypothetical protein [Candidatus Methylomirabilis sp.]